MFLRVSGARAARIAKSYLGSVSPYYPHVKGLLPEGGSWVVRLVMPYETHHVTVSARGGVIAHRSSRTDEETPAAPR